MLAVGQEFDQTAVGLPGIHLVSNHLKALPQLATAAAAAAAAAMQFVAIFGSVGFACTGVQCVHAVSDCVEHSSHCIPPCQMNGGNKQRKLAEHLQIPAAYLLIGLHLLKNFGQLASS